MFKQDKPAARRVEIKAKPAPSKQASPKRSSVGKTLDEKLLRKIGGGGTPVNRW
jgi:hypothetical protein